MEPILPANCEQHQPKYISNSWQDYSLMELGQFVHLLAKRSTHRKDHEKQMKDLSDAENYLDIMRSHIAALKNEAENAARTVAETRPAVSAEPHK